MHVEVLSIPPGTSLPVYYTVTWQPGIDGETTGFLRVAIAIDSLEPATYDVLTDVRAIEFSPDGSCCQQVCDKPWAWQNAWSSVAGDVVGDAFPLTVKTRIVLRPLP